GRTPAAAGGLPTTWPCRRRQPGGTVADEHVAAGLVGPVHADERLTHRYRRPGRSVQGRNGTGEGHRHLDRRLGRLDLDDDLVDHDLITDRYPPGDHFGLL